MMVSPQCYEVALTTIPILHLRTGEAERCKGVWCPKSKSQRTARKNSKAGNSLETQGYPLYRGSPGLSVSFSGQLSLCLWPGSSEQVDWPCGEMVSKILRLLPAPTPGCRGMYGIQAWGPTCRGIPLPSKARPRVSKDSIPDIFFNLTATLHPSSGLRSLLLEHSVQQKSASHSTAIRAFPAPQNLLLDGTAYNFPWHSNCDRLSCQSALAKPE